MGKISKFNGQYRFLSNFSADPVTYQGINYPTSEHAYQAQKVDNLILKREIASMKTPFETKQYGATFKPKDWYKRSLGIMYEIVKWKFIQNPDIRKKLLETGDLELIEGNHWKDTFWGKDDKTWEGENWLGKILMQVRDELKNGEEGMGIVQT